LFEIEKIEEFGEQTPKWHE
jgi:hypothetical protein